jgi:hypothetical protein
MIKPGVARRLAGVEVRCVRADEGMAGDEPNERADCAVTAFRALNDGGRFPCGGAGRAL